MPKPSRQKHQYVTKSGVQAQISIKGILYRRHFPKGTEQRIIREWLLKTELKYRTPNTRKTGRFEDDARAYLLAVAAMPTYAQRAQHIEQWIVVFGDEWRDRITADAIRAQLQTWRQTLAAASVNKRRTALMHLYSVLDGKAAINPVKDVPRFREPEPAPKSLTAADVQAIFAAMPSSKSKARLMVLAYTGIPPGQIAQIHVEDVSLEGRTVAVAGRKKGSGTRGRLVPLTTKGVAAFKLMRREEAWGGFSRVPLRRALIRACQRALGHARITPYDLRHFFGSEIYRRSGDIRATQILMDHSTPTLTHRYTLAAQDPRVKDAIRRWR
jgi:integrase